jgi:hypothetical protein
MCDTTACLSAFRERKSGGVKPELVHSQIVCQGGCTSLGNWHRFRCYLKPRCRWHVGVPDVSGARYPELAEIWPLPDPDGPLHVVREPYQLIVDLIENRRVEGKVRQQHIACLGTIPGHWLPGFFAGIDPAVLAQIVIEDERPHYDWRKRTLEARADFWMNANAVLERLGNRIDAAGRDKIMAGVDARVPQPSIAELQGTPLRRAEADLAGEERMHTEDLALADRYDGLARKAQVVAADLREAAGTRTEVIEEMRARVEQLRNRPPEAGHNGGPPLDEEQPGIERAAHELGDAPPASGPLSP